MPKKKKGAGFSHKKHGQRGGSGRRGRTKWFSDRTEEEDHDSSDNHDSDTSSVFGSAAVGICSSPDVAVTGIPSAATDWSVASEPASFPLEEPVTDVPSAATDCSVTSEPASFPLEEPVTGVLSAATNCSVTSEPASLFPLEVTEVNAEGTAEVVRSALLTLNSLLPLQWRAFVGREGFHVVLISRSTENIAIQREVYASFVGTIKVFVHRKEISDILYKDCLRDVTDLVSIDNSSKVFCDNILRVVFAVREYEICAGSDHKVKFEDVWSGDTLGFIDKNPYDESRYEKTFRSHQCALLVPVETWRCRECTKGSNRLKEKMKRHQDEEVKAHTRNTYLDPKQAKHKLEGLQKDLKNARRKIDYLSNQVAQALNQEGVFIEREYADDLTNILRHWGKLTPIEQMFIQQQVKSASCKGASGMRWHPAMVRLALSIQSTSNAAYTVLRDSGMVRLPCQKTLFDYSHAVPRSEGVFSEKLKIIGEKVKLIEEEDKQFHSLLMDEIHISQKLVYRKSDGSLVGYVKLEEVEIEMQNLIDTVNNDKGKFQPSVATKVLAYMIKGCTNKMKEVVAAFPTSTLTKEQLFSRTWQVIRACEGNGVKILAVVCDGSSINRSFIAMHTPATPSDSGIVFDTINLCAPERKIFFISDPPHLLKTIRNCFAKSGTSNRCTRLLTFGGEHIVWKTIERLYLTDVQSTLRRSYKLNSQNVYLNSYTCMKVSYAAQVMSRTVAMDLKDRNWPGTASTAHFILMVNNFFDCLNGSHMDIARKKVNDRLAPYTDVNDKRFQELKEFEKYIRDWGEEVANLEGVPPGEKLKMTLSSQTVEGISISVNAYIGAVQFLIGIGAKFVHGRTFCQDPLEQYFGKQRASLGGRNNPTVEGFLSSEMKISTHRDFNVKRRSGNTSSTPNAMQLDDEPLPKRRKTMVERRKSF